MDFCIFMQMRRLLTILAGGSFIVVGILLLRMPAKAPSIPSTVDFQPVVDCAAHRRAVRETIERDERLGGGVILSRESNDWNLSVEVSRVVAWIMEHGAISVQPGGRKSGGGLSVPRDEHVVIWRKSLEMLPAVCRDDVLSEALAAYADFGGRRWSDLGVIPVVDGSDDFGLPHNALIVAAAANWSTSASVRMAARAVWDAECGAFQQSQLAWAQGICAQEPSARICRNMPLTPVPIPSWPPLQ